MTRAPSPFLLSGRDAFRRVGQRKAQGRNSGTEGRRGSGPQKTGLGMPMRMAPRAGMFAKVKSIVGDEGRSEGKPERPFPYRTDEVLEITSIPRSIFFILN